MKMTKLPTLVSHCRCDGTFMVSHVQSVFFFQIMNVVNWDNNNYASVVIQTIYLLLITDNISCCFIFVSFLDLQLYYYISIVKLQFNLIMWVRLSLCLNHCTSSDVLVFFWCTGVAQWHTCTVEELQYEVLVIFNW